MKILTVDIGTGTQDIFLYDSNLDIENGFKLILPAPTMIVRRKVKEAIHNRTSILVGGRQMGGGPSAWAIEEAARAGLDVFMTPAAAQTLNDELDKVTALGIKIVTEDEAARIPKTVQRIEMKDFDFEAICNTFTAFGVSLDDLAAVVVAVFDHGNAPPGVSDRQFRFDYLDQRIAATGQRPLTATLSSFAYRAEDVPAIMTRLHAVADSQASLPCALIVMDTAPAAVLGATFDPMVARRSRSIICNIGNFHTIAFRISERGIDGVFEHHTGEIDRAKLEQLLRALADGTLKHEDVFNDMGHGALLYSQDRFEFGRDDFDVVVTGPRRSMFRTTDHGPQTTTRGLSSGVRDPLRPYFAAPFGDMMIAGCFGLLAATIEILPELAEPIHKSMSGTGAQSRAPWEYS